MSCEFMLFTFVGRNTQHDEARKNIQPASTSNKKSFYQYGNYAKYKQIEERSFPVVDDYDFHV